MTFQSFEAQNGDVGGIARLTAKERECLDRWLAHATAKEIALDLGISHHAVEKRLKSARQKLGVPTTLEAARLLADSRGYGQTASQAPELVASDPMTHTDVVDQRPAKGTSRDRRHWIIVGGTTMSLLLIVTLAGLGGSAFQTAPQPLPAPQVQAPSAADLKEASAKLFALSDKNNNGLLEKSELTGKQIRLVRAERGTGAMIEAEVEAVNHAAWDTDNDERLSLAEYQAGLSLHFRRR